MFDYFRNFTFTAKITDCLVRDHGIDNETADDLVAHMLSKSIAVLRKQGVTPKELAHAIVAEHLAAF